MNISINTSTIAKLGGWLQFILQLISGATAPGGGFPPHGITGWLTLVGSLLAAIGIHAASNTGGPPASAPGGVA